MIVPTKKDIGREVTYWVKYDGIGDVFDHGVLVGFSPMDHWVFVRYGSDETAKATRVQNLHWGHYVDVQEATEKALEEEVTP